MLFSSIAMRGTKKAVYLRFYNPAQHKGNKLQHKDMFKKRVPTFISGDSLFYNDWIKLNIDDRVPFQNRPYKTNFHQKKYYPILMVLIF